MSVGIWWLLFLLPLVFFVPERHSPIEVSSGTIRAAYVELRATMQKVGQYRNIVIFLSAYWLYLGGVFTVIFMAVNYGQRLGFADKDLVMALLITNFIGFPATFLYGLAAHRFGPRSGIYFALLIYTGMSAWAMVMQDVRQFYIMAMIIGTVQGGVQGLSRSLYASLIPPDQPGEFFGFYNMVTKFAHVLGPAMVADGGDAFGRSEVGPADTDAAVSRGRPAAWPGENGAECCVYAIADTAVLRRTNAAPDAGP